MQTDVLIVGGGPAGLAAAIATRSQGLRATVVDARRLPIDKTCGEGLLPEAVAALRALGVDLDEGPWFRFAGIRFCDGEVSAAARFGSATGRGVRRTILHRLLVERAEAAGVKLRWGARANYVDATCAEVAGGRIGFRWLVAADGLNSGIGADAGLGGGRRRGRFAFRRHYRIEPWTELVEVHWGRNCQIIVTPVGPEEVCVALFTSKLGLRIENALAQFPALAQRLSGARAASAETGARTALGRAPRVTSGNLALAGDASCSIDGIAGHGLNLAFHEAIHLAQALARGDLRGYERAHREITRTPMRITRLMLLLARSAGIRRKAMRMFEEHPESFAGMIVVHGGAAEQARFGWRDLCGLGWGVLRA